MDPARRGAGRRAGRGDRLRGEKLPELRDGYDARLEAAPGLAGRLKVSFTIGEDPEMNLGHVTESGVTDGGPERRTPCPQ
jgi:hypothetical protein